jgi:hypothetical protein
MIARFAMERIKANRRGSSLAVLWFVLGGAALAQGDPARAWDAATAAIRKPGTTVRVELIGDSTQTDNAGYGRGFWVVS